MSQFSPPLPGGAGSVLLACVPVSRALSLTMADQQKVQLDQLEEDDEFEEFDQVGSHYKPRKSLGRKKVTSFFVSCTGYSG